MTCIVVFVAAMAAITLAAFHSHHDRSMFIGIICVVFNVVMYAAPLTVMVMGSCSSSPPHVIILYGFWKKKKPFIIIIVSSFFSAAKSYQNQECQVYAILLVIGKPHECSCLAHLCLTQNRCIHNCKDMFFFPTLCLVVKKGERI